MRRGRTCWVTLDLERETYRAFYEGFANGTLWPLCHYRLGLISFRRAELEGSAAAAVARAPIRTVEASAVFRMAVSPPVVVAGSRPASAKG